MTTTLNLAQYSATQEKIEKINARAAKRGLAGHLTVEAGEPYARKVCDHDRQFPCMVFGEFNHHYEQAVEVEITGEAPKYAGWTFAARVDRVAGTEAFTLATAPGVEHVSREGIVLGYCDHCRTDRLRNTTYVLVNEAGEQVQVGSTCIKDFLGWAGNIAWLDAPAKVSDEWLGGSFHASPEYRVTEVLRVAIASTRMRGFVSAQSFSQQPTKSHVWLVWTADRFLKKHDMDAKRELIAAAAEVSDKDVEDLLGFLRSEDFNGTSTYVDNLKVLASVEFIGSNQFGLLASAPQAYNKHLGQVSERAARKTSEWVGAEGEKITTTGTVEKIVNCGSYSYSGPDSYLYIWRTEEGQVIKTFTTSSTFSEVEVGDTITVLGTVKKHEDYEGTKQTAVTCAKKVA